jgi:acetylornithine/succinyldiaminopimelate/putrescine aminotransferase
MNVKSLFFKHVAPVSDLPLQLEVHHAEGLYVYDTNGKAYMDLISGISVSNLGHRHPKIIAAIKAQADQYLHTMVYGEHIQYPQVALANLLCAQLPASLNSVYFTNSGSEATEGAMKVAKRFTGRSEFIAFEKSYHGSTQGALSLNSEPYFKDAFRPLLPGVRFIAFNSTEQLQYITTQTAAVFVETVKVEAGVQLIDADYFKALRARCTETGTLLVLDEIQTGMGRTGKLFSFEHFQVVPDILLTGKAFGAGLPLAAFIADITIMQTLSFQPVLGHITTFGGNPLCCAAALAGLRILLEEPQWMQLEARSRIFIDRLKHEKIIALRNFGFLMALELADFATMKKTMDACIRRGILTDWFLFADNCLRIAPPLTITSEEIETACNELLAALSE